MWSTVSAWATPGRRLSELFWLYLLDKPHESQQEASITWCYLLCFAYNHLARSRACQEWSHHITSLAFWTRTLGITWCGQPAKFCGLKLRFILIRWWMLAVQKSKRSRRTATWISLYHMDSSYASTLDLWSGCPPRSLKTKIIKVTQKWLSNSVHTRCIAKTSGFTRSICKNCWFYQI